MSMIFILIQIKFEIEINNDELLKIIWEHQNRKKKSWLSLIVYGTMKPMNKYDIWDIKLKSISNIILTSWGCNIHEMKIRNSPHQGSKLQLHQKTNWGRAKQVQHSSERFPNGIFNTSSTYSTHHKHLHKVTCCYHRFNKLVPQMRILHQIVFFSFFLRPIHVYNRSAKLFQTLWNTNEVL